MSLIPEEEILTDTSPEESDERFWEKYSTEHRNFINHYLNEAF